MRLYRPGDPIRVRCSGEGRPLAFTWHGEPYRVDSIEEVREPRLDWWSATGEIHRVYFLVVTNRALICEIFRDVPTGEWFMARVFD
jgi:hypothetical protein